MVEAPRHCIESRGFEYSRCPHIFGIVLEGEKSYNGRNTGMVLIMFNDLKYILWSSDHFMYCFPSGLQLKRCLSIQ